MVKYREAVPARENERYTWRGSGCFDRGSAELSEGGSLERGDGYGRPERAGANLDVEGVVAEEDLGVKSYRFQKSPNLTPTRFPLVFLIISKHQKVKQEHCALLQLLIG